MSWDTQKFEIVLANIKFIGYKVYNLLLKIFLSTARISSLTLCLSFAIINAFIWNFSCIMKEDEVIKGGAFDDNI